MLFAPLHSVKITPYYGEDKIHPQGIKLSLGGRRNKYNTNNAESLITRNEGDTWLENTAIDTRRDSKLERDWLMEECFSEILPWFSSVVFNQEGLEEDFHLNQVVRMRGFLKWENMLLWAEVDEDGLKCFSSPQSLRVLMMFSYDNMRINLKDDSSFTVLERGLEVTLESSEKNCSQWFSSIRNNKKCIMKIVRPRTMISFGDFKSVIETHLQSVREGKLNYEEEKEKDDVREKPKIDQNNFGWNYAAEVVRSKIEKRVKILQYKN